MTCGRTRITEPTLLGLWRATRRFLVWVSGPNTGSPLVPEFSSSTCVVRSVVAAIALSLNGAHATERSALPQRLVPVSFFKAVIICTLSALFICLQILEKDFNPPKSLLRGLFPVATLNGISVHSNSWGTKWGPGYVAAYSCASAEIDKFINENPFVSIVFSAGNAGDETEGPTLTDEAQSKNSIVVGASTIDFAAYLDVLNRLQDYSFLAEGQRIHVAQELACNASETTGVCAFVNSLNPSTCCSTAGPYCSGSADACGCVLASGGQVFAIGENCCQACDVEAAELIASALTVDSVSLFSSRGPAVDGRIKPDVVAPGDIITSARAYSNTATQFNNICGLPGFREDPNDLVHQTAQMPGTSMAAPTVSGYILRIREYLARFYPNMVSNATGAAPIANPSSALIRALVINSAVSMSGQYYTGSHYENLRVTTYSAQGFGRISLETIIPSKVSPSTVLRVLTTSAASFSASNETASFVHSYISGSTSETTVQGEVRITLAWNDPAATVLSARQLVNNLDLLVRDTATGILYMGNADILNSQSFDSINNAERVILYADSSRTLEISVIARAILSPPQTFEVVLSSRDVGTSPAPIPPPPPPPGESKAPASGGDNKKEEETIAISVATTAGVGSAAAAVAVFVFFKKKRQQQSQRQIGQPELEMPMLVPDTPHSA